MIYQKATNIPGIPLSSFDEKASLQKSPAFEKIYKTIIEIGQNSRNPAQASQGIAALCDELIENVAVSRIRFNANSYKAVLLVNRNEARYMPFYTLEIR